MAGELLLCISQCGGSCCAANVADGWMDGEMRRRNSASATDASSSYSSSNGLSAERGTPPIPLARTCRQTVDKDGNGSTPYDLAAALPQPLTAHSSLILHPVARPLVLPSSDLSPLTVPIMPPFRHLVFFKFMASSKPEQRQAVIDGLRRLPSVLPNILYYELFPLATNAYPGHHTLNQGYTLLIDSIFASADALSVYGPSDAHQSVVRELIAPIREDNLIVDYPLPDSFDVAAFKQLQTAPHARHIVLYRLKADAAGQADGINAQFKRVQDDVPAVISSIAGTQPSEPVYSGWPDRSKGFVNVLELVANDAAGLQQYHQHKDHDKVKEHCKPLVDDLIQYDYLMADRQQ